MRKVFLSLLAALSIFPAVSFARDYPRYDHGRYDRVYRGRPWYGYNRPGYWHSHRAAPGYRYDYYRRQGWYDRRHDRPWHRFGD